MKPQGKKKMNPSLWILLAITLVALLAAYFKGPHLPASGLLAAGRLLQNVWIELALGFVLAGLLEVLIPAPMLAAWLGDGRLGRGILTGWGVGLLLPGGPYVLFPVVAGLAQKGAAAGPLICLLTAKTLVSPIRMFTYEAPLLGWPLTLARFIPGVLAAPILGILGHYLFLWLKNRAG
jgi:uncharacterized membrane protein YraQ (UPF0718 family)